MKVAIVGDFDPNFKPHTATDLALEHASHRLEKELTSIWVPTQTLEIGYAEILANYDGLIIAPGSPYKSLMGGLNAVKFARLHQVPMLASCGGYQHVVLEFARNVLKFKDVQHAEYDPYASDLIVTKLICSLKGKKLSVVLKPDSNSFEIYGCLKVDEAYYCNFGLDPTWLVKLLAGGMKLGGVDEDGEARILELGNHPFFIATLFVPALTSKFDAPHPLFLEFLKTCSQ